LNPGPSSSWAGDRNAAHKPQKKAADVTRFWLGRSVARRLLGLATTEELEKKSNTEGKDIRCLRKICLRAKRQSFPKKE
jgi:hypothetical protein